ncbi:MAG: D-alanyl-D-alanine carboxypeptidase [Oscillospiraceae bacterium]|nr:D-alanyl-D-alanine carboxypeptidase [Oscillospiraceae bacterium]
MSKNLYFISLKTDFKNSTIGEIIIRLFSKFLRIFSFSLNLFRVLRHADITFYKIRRFKKKIIFLFFKYKKILCSFFLIYFLTNYSIFVLGLEKNEISAKSAIIICADSNDIIWEKNAHEPRPMASTTKIMTALLAIEESESHGNRNIEITKEMIHVEGTSMGLCEGDIVNFDALAAGMLLSSGNDAANAAAILVSGTKEKFIECMNERAKQLGLENTSFKTPSGLDQTGHYSTAFDMATLGAYAMENKKFAEIVSQKYKKIEFINPEKNIKLKNHNKLLKLYEYCIGIKTGFTKKSGRCLVSCAEKDGVRLIAVTLKASNDWDDHKKLYNFGFSQITNRVFDESNFEIELPVIKGEKEYLKAIGTTKFHCNFKLESKSKIQRILDIPKTINAPIRKGDLIGDVNYFLGKKKIGKNAITASEDINEKKRKNIFRKIIDLFKNIFNFLARCVSYIIQIFKFS